MPCGCTDNNKLNNNKRLDNDKKLSIESMQTLSIDEIISLYRQGYALNDVDTASEMSNINVLTYGTQCSGNPELAFSYETPLAGTFGAVQKGKVWAQRFYGNFRCLDFVRFNMQRSANVNFYIEIRRDDGAGEGKPIGVPLVDDSGLILRTPSISYTDIPTSSNWVQETIAAILPTDAYYWICFVPVDFYDSPTYRDDPTDDRFLLQDTTNITDKRSAVFMNGIWANSSTFAFSAFKLPTFVVNCESITLSASPNPVIQEQTTTLTATTTPAIAGFNVIFKDGGTPLQTVATNSSGVATYPWNTAGQSTGAHSMTAVVTGQCTSSTTTLTINSPPCTTITLSASPTSGTIGTTINLTATVTNPPNTAGFSVTFKDGITTLGTGATNSSGVATYTWDTSAQIAGAHSITASVVGQCTSNAVIVNLTAPAQNCTTITLSASPTSGTIGITVNLTATVTNPPNTAGFSVTFKDGIATLGTGGTNSSGVATYAWDTSGQIAGAHSITASVGSPVQCTSSAVTVNLTAPAQPCVAISLVANPTSIQQGQSTTLTTTVTNPPNTAGYNVDFKVDGYIVAMRTTNSSGVATYSLNTSSLTVATHYITTSVGSPVQCTSSTVTIDVTAAPAAGGGGVIVIAAVALVAAAMFMARKPPTSPT